MFRLPFVVLVALMVALASCDRLKPKAPAPKAVVVPEIVDEPAAAPEPKEPLPALDPAVPELTINKSATVAVLGYHEFVRGAPANDMQLSIDRFRSQMQAIKDARLNVIPMSDFLAWRAGTKDIPDPSIVITMDDGWKSVHTLALPVLKEFGYPFTIFLYKKFVNLGGKSLTLAEIQDLTNAGGEIGSHSVSHPYKQKIEGNYRQSQALGDQFLRSEMIDSRQFLEDLFKKPVLTYAYPGGYFTPREEEIGREAGYAALFTVNPSRVTWDTPATALGRFIILGTDERESNFKRAISSRGATEDSLVKQLLGGEGEALVSTTPAPNGTTKSRRPVIEVDVAKLQGIDPESISVRLAGFGRIPAVFDREANVIRAEVRESLRTNECQVYVQFKRQAEPKPDLVSWRFFVDLVADFLPDRGEPNEKAIPIAEEVPAPPVTPAK
jgi:peptidoglycan/xylan/chitin deacetylase (PgdA/CDA1 family)